MGPPFSLNILLREHRLSIHLSQPRAARSKQPKNQSLIYRESDPIFEVPAYAP